MHKLCELKLNFKIFSFKIISTCIFYIFVFLFCLLTTIIKYKIHKKLFFFSKFFNQSSKKKSTMSFNDDFDVDEDEKDRLVHLNRSRPKPARSVKLRVKDPVKISNVAIKEDDEDEEASDEEVIHKGNTKDDILKKVQKAGGVAMPFTANLSDLKKNKRFTCYANLSANNELTKIEMSKPEVSNFTAKQKIEDDKHIENIVRLRRVNQSDNKENSVKQSEQENSKKPPIQIKLKTPTEEKKSEILDFLAHKPLDEPNRLIPVKELARIFNNGKVCKVFFIAFKESKIYFYRPRTMALKKQRPKNWIIQKNHQQKRIFLNI